MTVCHISSGKTQAAVALLVLLIGMAATREFGHASLMSRPLRILDINVWSGLDYRGAFRMGEYEPAAVRQKRYQALLIQIKQLDPDVIAIHEANKLPGYAKRLATATGYVAFYHVSVGGIRLGPVGIPWNLREGDVILAKKELQPEFVGRKRLSGGFVSNWATFHLTDATQVIAVKIRYQNTPLYVFATHWHAAVPDTPETRGYVQAWYEAGQLSQGAYHRALEKIRQGVAWRWAESQQTRAFIQQQTAGQPFVLMGDFNAESGSREIGNLLQFGMVDVFRRAHPNLPGFTWDPSSNLNQKTHYQQEPPETDLHRRLERRYRARPLRIDYIFLGPSTLVDSGKLAIHSSRVVMDQVIDGVHASDHYGVLAEIALSQ